MRKSDALHKERFQMTRSTCPSMPRLFAGAVLLLCTGLAHAQYAWINANGNHEYSDRPPPPSTPRSKILKAPRGSPLLLEADAAAPAQAKPEDTKADKKKGPPTLAERDADFRKRQKEQGEQEQKASDEAQRKQAVAENCAAARQNKAQLESGIRIADATAQGEPTFISDEERARRLAGANRALAGCR
jgi:type IV secretory pathway VirB10-like protein